MRFKVGDRVHYKDDPRDTGTVEAVFPNWGFYHVAWDGIGDAKETPFADSVLEPAVKCPTCGR